MASQRPVVEIALSENGHLKLHSNVIEEQSVLLSELAMSTGSISSIDSISDRVRE